MAKQAKSKKLSKKEQLRVRRRRNRILVAAAFILAVIVGELLVRGGWPFGGKSSAQKINNPDAPLASFYAPEVLRWRDEIERWAQEYDLNPNVIAIIMQIESCGDPVAISSAGALGLMQVMPFHFDNGENMLNPDTNVERGMGHLFACLEFGNWDMGRALACYNGGFVQEEAWATETRAYYYWGTGLWEAVTSGSETSEVLDEWLAAGGRNLCNAASQQSDVPTATQPRVSSSPEGVLEDAATPGQ